MIEFAVNRLGDMRPPRPPMRRRRTRRVFQRSERPSSGQHLPTQATNRPAPIRNRRYPCRHPPVPSSCTLPINFCHRCGIRLSNRRVEVPTSQTTPSARTERQPTVPRDFTFCACCGKLNDRTLERRREIAAAQRRDREQPNAAT